MIHLIFEGNKDLENRTFPLAKGIRKHLQATLDNYTGDKTIDGYKRLNNILDMDTISYHELKRIKNFFDNYNGTPKSAEFILNGGEPMKTWVNNTLGTATKSIHDFKQAKKEAGVSNAFIKPHEKQRQIKKNKPTFAKFQTNDITNNISNDNAIRYESKDRKVICISENVYRQLTAENIDEGWKNWAMAGALGAATMFGNPQNANAQNINQQNDTTQADTVRNQNGGFNFGDVLRSKGKSENEIQQIAKSINPGNIMLRNSKGEENNKIKKFLSTLPNISKSMSTDSIKVFGSSDYKERMNYLKKFTEEMAKKYKMFYDSNENTFIMPANYTLDKVQSELTFQLGDFDI